MLFLLIITIFFCSEVLMMFAQPYPLASHSALPEALIDTSLLTVLAAEWVLPQLNRTVIALGQSFDLAVIAEGVETEAQRNFLAVYGCNYYQGYFFGKPVPLTEFELLFAQR